MARERVGRYEITEVLGRGAVAVVYLARDPVIDRLVALKTLRLDLAPAEAEEFGPRFLREARAAGRLSHPGIVTIFDAGEDREQGALFIAMEYVEGSSLKQLIQAGTAFTPRQIADLGRSLAEALEYAHRNGIVHRDVKPANVLLTRDGVAKLTDFGIARMAASEHTLEGTILGTPSYMSPEQVSGGPVDGRTDVYSLGVLLFQLLSGMLPFGGGSVAELSLKILKQPAPDLGKLLPVLAPTLAPIVRRCLEKRPEDRYQSAGELAQALANIAGQAPANAVAPSPAVGGVPPRANGFPPVATPADDVFPVTPKTRIADAHGEARAEAVAHIGGKTRRRWTSRPWLVALAIGGAIVLALVGGQFLLRSTSRSPRWAAGFLGQGSARTWVDIASMRLRGGDLQGAIDAARRALESDPGSAQARAILDEARRRVEEASRPAEIAVGFLSPTSSGSATFTLDGRPLDHVSWNFRRKLILGITLPRRGEVRAALKSPPGDHELGARVLDADGRVVAETTFPQRFAPGSRWTLGLAPARRDEKPALSLVEAEPAVQPTPRPEGRNN